LDDDEEYFRGALTFGVFLAPSGLPSEQHNALRR